MNKSANASPMILIPKPDLIGKPIPGLPPYVTVLMELFELLAPIISQSMGSIDYSKIKNRLQVIGQTLSDMEVRLNKLERLVKSNNIVD